MIVHDHDHYFAYLQASSDMHGVASYVEEVKALTEKGTFMW